MPISLLDLVYADDEALYLTRRADFNTLLPTSADLIVGTGGSIAASSPWDLETGQPLQDAQIKPGMMVLLTVGRGVAAPVGWTPSGEWFVVDLPPVDTKLTLRRPGMASGAGQAPGPLAGTLGGLNFKVRTLQATIEEQSYQLNQDLAIDPEVPGRTPDDIMDLRQLRLATVLMTLINAYENLIDSDDDDNRWAQQANLLRAQLDRVMTRLTLRWRDADADSGAGFGARYSR